MNACEGMTDSSSASHARNSHTDGKGLSVTAAVNWFSTNTQQTHQAQPVLLWEGGHPARLALLRTVRAKRERAITRDSSREIGASTSRSTGGNAMLC